jgi:hypothetical protein
MMKRQSIQEEDPTVKKLMMAAVLGMLVAACGGAAEVVEQAGEAIDDLGDESVFSMEVGLCFDDEADAADEVSSVPDVPCDEPHDNEVFALIQYTGETFPGADAMQAEAVDLCIGEFEGYVGLAYEESELEVFPLVPTQASWDGGDREIVCALYALDLSQLTGSMKGAAR